jgi:hypothetical protein
MIIPVPIGSKGICTVGYLTSRLTCTNVTTSVIHMRWSTWGGISEVTPYSPEPLICLLLDKRFCFASHFETKAAGEIISPYELFIPFICFLFVCC